MNGLLQRLAAQAIGSTNTLRSAARPPYAAAPAPIHRRQAATPSAAGAERQQADNTDTEWKPAPGQARHRDNLDVETGAHARENAVKAPPPEALVAPSTTNVAVQMERDNIQTTTVNASLRQPNTSAQRTVASESAVLVAGIEAQIPMRDSATGPIANQKQYPTLSDSDAPPPLLPLQIPARLLPLNSAVPTQQAESGNYARQSQVEETTEVHVSIGRIEVTAVHESAPPRRTTPPQAKPMTLDEYFARRQEKK